MTESRIIHLNQIGNHTILIRPDGTHEAKQWTEGRPDAHWLHQQVEGYIEPVPYWHSFIENGKRLSCIAYCNEDGKREEKAYNHRATVAWDAALKRARTGDGMVIFPGGVGDLGDHLVGNVVLVIGDEWFMGKEEEEDDPA